MSVVGVDIGDYKSVVAVARNRGIDIVTNEVSNRFTPSMVGFSGDQRLLGEAAKTQEVMNFKNTITGIKRLLGRNLDEADIQNNEKKFYLYNLLADETGGAAAQVDYQGETKVFSFVQLSGMYLTLMKKIAEAALKTGVSDIVLSVPAYYTEIQRQALLNASEIAGLNCLRLITEPAAAALVYGITRAKDLPEAEPRHVVFVDVGHSAMTVSVAAFTKEKAVIKSTAFDRHLGGRQFDEDLVQHFAKEILAKYKLDVNTRPKALLRLRVACEKLKKVLSANQTAVLNVESLTDDVDVHSTLTREQFEELIKLSLERVEAPLRIALHNAGIRKDQVEFVELIGGSSRIPAIRKIVSEFFSNREGLISTTLNLDEAVARGAAFQCAMISPLFKVRDYGLKDVNVYDIKAGWVTDASTMDVVIFKEGDGVPSTKSLTFYRSAPFEISVFYSNAHQLPSGGRTQIARFFVKDVKPVNGKPAEIKAKIRLNPNGMITVESAFVIEEIEEDSDKMDATTTSAESKQEEGSAKEEEPATPTATPTATPPAAADGEKKEEEKKEEKKRKIRKTELKVEVENTSLPTKTITALREAENAMIASDKLIADTQEKRNSLEEYIYDIRNKLAGDYGKYVDEKSKEQLLTQLTESEDWLYSEGETAQKGVFVERLDALKKIGSPLIDRYTEAESRPKAVSDLRTTINQLRNAAQSWEEKFEHIEAAEREKIVNKCAEKEKWLDEQLNKQNALNLWDTPVLRTASIYAERESLVTFSSPILNKPKPKPKVDDAAKAAPPPTPTATTEEPKKEEAPKPAEGKGDEAKPDEPVTEEKQELELGMDVD